MNDLHIHTNIQPRFLTPVLTALHPQNSFTVTTISVQKSWNVQKHMASQTWVGINKGGVWPGLRGVSINLETDTGLF